MTPCAPSSRPSCSARHRLASVRARWLASLIPPCLIAAAIAGSAAVGAPTAAQAAVPPELPYAQRTRSYAGWRSTVRGDIPQIGMAGAMVGLADSFVSSADNPAGLAMTFGGISLTTNLNQVRDREIQSYDSPASIANIGLAATRYPYGFSAGWWTTADEGRPYLANGANFTVEPQIQVREFRFSGARFFADQRISVGASLMVAQAQERLNFPDSPGQNLSESELQLGITLGALWQIDPSERFFLGASYTPASTFEFDDVASNSTGVADFFQPIEMPWRLALGVGWVPNRHFRAGVALYAFGATPNTALLKDQSLRVAEHRTVQPRIGARYRFADLRLLRASAGLGTYVEPSRIRGQPTRVHGTMGVDFEIWAFDLGFAIDRSSGYQNSIFALGLDIGRSLEMLDLIPKQPRAKRQGWFPRAITDDSAELPRPINPAWKASHQMDLIEIGRQLPERVEKKVEQLSDALDDPGSRSPTPEQQRAREERRVRSRRQQPKGNGGTRSP